MNHLSVIYRGPLSSCNYACPYCPFAKHTESAAEHAADARALTRFADWAAAQKDAPFDLIVIDGAVEEFPDAFLALARDGARIVSGVSEGPVTRLATGVVLAGKVALKSFIDSEIAPLAAFARKPEFVF